METYNNINEKLFYIQQQLSAPKTKSNDHGHYKYRSMEDILEAVKPLLSQVNCTILLNDEIQEAGGKLYIKASAKLTDGKEMVICTAYAREAERLAGMSEPQITGASSSYARKYALCGLLAIDDNKDLDSLPPEKPRKATATKKTAADILGEALDATPKKDDYPYSGFVDAMKNTKPEPKPAPAIPADVDQLPF